MAKLPTEHDLQQLSLRATVGFSALCARRLPYSHIGDQAIQVAEEFARGNDVDRATAQQIAKKAIEAGDIIAGKATASAIEANTRGGYPGAPMARRRAYSIAAEIAVAFHDTAHADAVQQDFERLLAQHKSTFPRFGDSIDLENLGADQAELLIQSEIVLLGDKTSEGQLVELLAVPWFEIIREIRHDPEFLHRIDWRKMEEVIAGAYEQMGCVEVTLTPRSGDDGKDVMATLPGIGSIRIVDQVKKYKPGHLVNADEIRSMLGVLNAEPNVSKGFVTTTSSFAPGILENEKLMQFMPYRLELRDGKQLADWLTSLTDDNATEVL